MVRIEILSGPEGGRIVELKPGLHRVGRGKDNDLVLPVESVSGRHLELTVGADGSVRFKDLGSTNGTFFAGVATTEGEWFAGSELRLGACALKHLAAGEAGLLAEAAADDGDARARAAALQGPRGARKGLMFGAVAGLMLGGGALAWFLLQDSADPARSAGGAAGDPIVAQQDPDDLLGGLGRFEDPDSWSLSDGASWRDGALSLAGRGRAACLRTLPIEEGGLRVQAEASGGVVRAWISFGADEAEASAWAAWISAPLQGTGAEIALPEGARWFQVALAADETGATVRSVRVESVARALSARTSPIGRLFFERGNLLVLDGEVATLAVAGADGAWAATEDGLTLDGGGESHWRLAGEFAEAAALSDGGPVALRGGVRVESSPGLLCGGSTRRLLVRCETPATWLAVEGGARLEASGNLRLTWNLESALTEAARLTRELVEAARAQDDGRLLTAAARLLRDVPLDEEKTAAARQAQRDALARGQRSLGELQGAVSGALFIGAVEALEPLAVRAERLAATFVGTPLGAEAEGLGLALRGAAEAGRAAADAADAEWRTRLQTALERAYPVIAQWVAAQDAALAGGAR